MKNFKKIVFALFSLFLIYRTYELTRILLFSSTFNPGTVTVIFIAFLINLYVTGIFAFPGFVFPTSHLVNQNYFRIRKKSFLIKIYNILGVDNFRKLLLYLFWGRGNNRTRFFSGKRSGFDNFSYQSRQSEFGHVSSFSVITIISLLLIIKGYFLMAGITLLMNIVVNLYPVILQRFNRMRIERIDI